MGLKGFPQAIGFSERAEPVSHSGQGIEHVVAHVKAGATDDCRPVVPSEFRQLVQASRRSPKSMGFDDVRLLSPNDVLEGAVSLPGQALVGQQSQVNDSNASATKAEPPYV